MFLTDCTCENFINGIDFPVARSAEPNADAETSNGSSSRNAQVDDDATTSAADCRNRVDTATTISDDKPKIKKEVRRRVSVFPVCPIKYLLNLLPIKK
jgi:hypothetical protein